MTIEPRRSGAVRILALALGLALMASFAPIDQTGWVGGPSSVAAAAGGRLLLPRNNGLTVMDVASGVEQPLYPTRQVILGAAWSPDGGRVAFVQWIKAPGDRYGGADLYLLDGGQAAPVVAYAGPDQTLSSPVWTPDGRALIYQVSGATAGGFSVEQAALDGSDRQTLESGAASPALSPDGSLLAFVRVTDYDVLAVRPLAGGAARELMAQDAFVGLSAPRFSPDGRRIAFLGIGGPSSNRLPAPADPLALLRLGPAAAFAHGIPWDPWVINVDGSGLRQVASLASDDPSVAWAPDGSSLAVLGGDGLWLVPLDGSQSPSMIGYGSYGMLDWRP